MGNFERIAKESGTIEQALDALAGAGATPARGMAALKRGRGMSWADAKEAVCKSSSWPDWDVAQETLVRELENMDDSSIAD